MASTLSHRHARGHIPRPGTTAVSLILAAACAWGATADARDTSPEEEAGRALAAELREQRPAASATNQARLKLRDGRGRRTSLPVAIVTRVQDQDWSVSYTAGPPSQSRLDTLTILHRPDAPPVYELAATRPAEPASPVRISAGNAFIPFAGSEFWLADLGREFLHWPSQRLLRREPHSGRMCGVLESLNPGTNGYARVLSWIDAEYRGLLGAEAYDANGSLVKRFATGSIVRQGESYLLKDIKIRDMRTDALTELEFDPTAPTPP